MGVCVASQVRQLQYLGMDLKHKLVATLRSQSPTGVQRCPGQHGKAFRAPAVSVDPNPMFNYGNGVILGALGAAFCNMLCSTYLTHNHHDHRQSPLSLNTAVATPRQLSQASRRHKRAQIVSKQHTLTKGASHTKEDQHSSPKSVVPNKS